MSAASDRDGGGVDLPEGWALAPLSELTLPVANIRPEDAPGRLFGYIDISAIDNQRNVVRLEEIKRFKGIDAPSRARREVRPGDVLFSNVRTNLRNIAILPDGVDADLCSTGFTVLRSSGAMDSNYLFRSVLTDAFIDVVSEQQTGTHYPAASDRVILAQVIAVPPLAEQRRIVTKMESLLSDAAVLRERLGKVPLILNRFRQAILEHAFTGKLTEQWRTEHTGVASAASRWNLEGDALAAEDLPELPDTWVYRPLRQISERVSVGHVGPTSQYYCDPARGVPFIRSQNVRPRRLDLSEIQYITREFHDQSRKSQLRAGDLLVVRVGANRGDTCVVPDGLGEINCANIVFARPYVGISTWIEHYCQSPLGARLLEDMTTGSAQGVLNTSAIAELAVPIPPEPEQQEVLRRVDALFALADVIEKRVAAAIARADKVPQAILAKAFRGELVPTEAELARREGRDYEPASALLERIRRERAAADDDAPAPRRRRAR